MKRGSLSSRSSAAAERTVQNVFSIDELWGPTNIGFRMTMRSTLISGFHAPAPKVEQYLLETLPNPSTKPVSREQKFNEAVHGTRHPQKIKSENLKSKPLNPPASSRKRVLVFWGKGRVPESTRSEALDIISDYIESSRLDTTNAIHPIVAGDGDIVRNSDPVAYSDENSSGSTTPRALGAGDSIQDWISNMDHGDVDNFTHTGRSRSSRSRDIDFSIVLNHKNFSPMNTNLQMKLQDLFRFRPARMQTTGSIASTSTIDTWGNDYPWRSPDENEVEVSLYLLVSNFYEIVVTPAPERILHKLHIGSVFKYMLTFLNVPPPPEVTIRCRVIRTKRGFEGSLWPEYVLCIERNGNQDIFLMAARKRRSVARSSYVFSVNPADVKKESKCCIGVLVGNLKRSKYKFYSPRGFYDEYIHYEGRYPATSTHILSVSFGEEESFASFNSPRRIRAAMPKLKDDIFRVINQDEKVKVEDPHYIQLKNRAPIWNPDTCKYCMDFNNRVTESSVKNFILTSRDDETCHHNVLLFGKTGHDEFALDFSYPMCPIQAFAIAVANFDVSWCAD